MSFFDFHDKVTARRETPQGSGSGPSGPKPLSVTELTAQIERVIRTGLAEQILIRAEVSNYRRNQASGHLYFTLKDSQNCIDCVMWKSDAARMKFEPADGMELIASGRVGVYGSRGRYQLYAGSLRPLGQGALELAFQQTKARLEAAGLFAAQRKKPLPAFPIQIAIVTSRATAALQDVLKVLRRYPWLRLGVYHVPVQGEGAAARIAAALDHLNATRPNLDRGTDLILLARGGGSLEDLWPFNEEIVARSVAASVIPIITGIGHEVDTSIADLAADYHAHTPTEAAQVAVASWRKVADDVDMSGVRLRRALRTSLAEYRQRLASMERHEVFRRPLDRVNQLRQLLDDRQRCLAHAGATRLHDAHRRLADFSQRLGQGIPAAAARVRVRIDTADRAMAAAMSQQVRAALQTLARAEVRLGRCQPVARLQVESARLAAGSQRLTRGLLQMHRQWREKLDVCQRHLEAVSPRAVLSRGYTITTRRDGTLIRGAVEVKTGDRILTRFADGVVDSTAQNSAQLLLFE